MSLLAFCVPLFLYALPIYGLTWWYHRMRRSIHARFAWVPLALMLVIACATGVYTVMTFGGAFGPGSFLLMGAIPVTIVGVLFHLFIGYGTSSSRKTKDEASGQRWVTRIVVTLFIIGVNMAPITGYASITSFCFKAHVWTAGPIIEALESYQAENGTYPSDLEALVPQYLESIPRPLCFDLVTASDKISYALEWCPVYDGQNSEATDERPILWLPVIQSGFPQRYDLQTGEWDSISFLDGICSYLG